MRPTSIGEICVKRKVVNHLLETYLDNLPLVEDIRQAKVNALRELQSASGEEL